MSGQRGTNLLVDTVLVILTGQRDDLALFGHLGQGTGAAWFLFTPQGGIACPTIVTCEVAPHQVIGKVDAVIRTDHTDLVSQMVNQPLAIGEEIAQLGIPLPQPRGNADREVRGAKDHTHKARQEPDRVHGKAPSLHLEVRHAKGIVRQNPEIFPQGQADKEAAGQGGHGITLPLWQ
jgi:hypothetical protein